MTRAQTVKTTLRSYGLWTMLVQGLASPPAYDDINKDTPVDPAIIAQTFLQNHHMFSPASMQYRPLPAPVILPQRRPKNKQRGFVRGYAPLLGECSGIDQQTFLDFPSLLR